MSIFTQFIIADYLVVESSDILDVNFISSSCFVFDNV